MPSRENKAPLNPTPVKPQIVERNPGQHYGHVLTTLAELFGNSSKGGPPAVLLVETKAGRGFYEAGRFTAQERRLPVIFADADLAIDEIHGAPVGRIESTGDSLFRKIDETPAGIVVINNADQISSGNGRVLERIFDGKPLTLPGLDHAIDFSKWTIVLGVDENSEVSPGLKSRAGAVLSLNPKL